MINIIAVVIGFIVLVLGVRWLYHWWKNKALKASD